MSAHRLVLPLLIALLALTESPAMTQLDSRKYFSDPATAAFVDQVQRGDAAAVRQALAAGQDPNAAGLGGMRPLHFVFAAKGPAGAAVAELLLAAGADPNAKAPNGHTPLHYAVQQPEPGFTEALLRHKADPRLPGENGQPVLYLALSSPAAPHTLPLLVRAGADPNQVWGGYPPVQAALVQQDWPAALLLLRLGADPALRTKQGETVAQTFCRLLARLNPKGSQRALVAAVGDQLGAAVPAECQARLAQFR